MIRFRMNRYHFTTLARESGSDLLLLQESTVAYISVRKSYPLPFPMTRKYLPFMHHFCLYFCPFAFLAPLTYFWFIFSLYFFLLSFPPFSHFPFYIFSPEKNISWQHIAPQGERPSFPNIYTIVNFHYLKNTGTVNNGWVAYNFNDLLSYATQMEVTLC